MVILGVHARIFVCMLNLCSVECTTNCLLISLSSLNEVKIIIICCDIDRLCQNNGVIVHIEEVFHGYVWNVGTLITLCHIIRH